MRLIGPMVRILANDYHFYILQVCGIEGIKNEWSRRVDDLFALPFILEQFYNSQEIILFEFV